MDAIHPFLSAFRGDFYGILRWHQLTTLWEVLKANTEKQWYAYAVGEAPPEMPFSNEQLSAFLEKMDHLLRREHQEDYCGVVYADNPDDPHFVKIFDPNNLGVSCGFSDNPPLPGWILSLEKPIDLPTAIAPPKNRQRWWKNLFG